MKPDAANTVFVIDMQRKLHRWGVADVDKAFADLFNIVCDRKTLSESWRRLTRNKGSRTPGTDGVTRKTVEEGPGGTAQFIEDTVVGAESHRPIKTARRQNRPACASAFVASPAKGSGPGRPALHDVAY